MASKTKQASLFARLGAAAIDFILLAATSMMVLALCDYAASGVARREYNKSRELTQEDINERYNSVFGPLPIFQDENAILQHQFLGLAHERNDANLAHRHKLWNERAASADTRMVTLSDSDVVLMFPFLLSSEARQHETQDFASTYSRFVKAGNALDRFRLAFPEFKDIPANLLVQTLHEHFFYKLDDEAMRKAFGFGGMKTEDQQHVALAALLIAAYVMIYFSSLESSAMAASLGKRVMGIKISSDDGSNYHRLTLAQAAGYTLCSILGSILTLFTVFLPLLLNKTHRTFYDKWFGVHVVARS